MTSARVDEHPGIGTGFGRLRDRVAIVTGADSGIGRATARLFAREGAKVVCADIQETGEPRVDRLIQEDGGEAVFVQTDVSKREDCDRMVQAALDNFGDLDILFNNAGVGVRGYLHEMTDEEWDFVVNVNLYGMYHGVRAALPHFLKREKGNIVTTASTFGIWASGRYPGYSATKAAIVNLTRELALDYGPNIRVNCVCPGGTDTPRFRGFPPRPTVAGLSAEQKANMGVSNKAMKRMARPEEIAYGVLFLASDESSFITGHPLVVDGGQTIGM